jgi:nitroreductase
MMLAAWAEGITSCPTSMHRPEDAARVLGLPPEHRVAIALPFGYPAESERRRSNPRLPLADYVYSERWGEPDPLVREPSS